jgi:catechol 2,3-dioxygenase-like lactoylglutathione lyase family enzyme
LTIGWNFTKRIVADLDAAERFYAAMGLKVVSRLFGGDDDDQVRQQQTYMSASGDGTSHQLILCRFPAYPPPSKPAYPGESWMCLNVADVDETCRTAAASGGSVFRAGQDRPEHGVRAAIIADADGQFIEIIGPMAGA